MNANQTRICVCAGFAVFYAVFRELAHAMESHGKPSEVSICLEVGLIGVVTLFALFLTRDKNPN
jgi:hypothetical protein